MPTKNRRIAAYLPDHLKERFQAFKSDRNISGDSQALIIILSEFLGVSQEVAHQGSSVNLELQGRVEELEEKITQLKDELLSELRRELLEHRSRSIEQAKAEVKGELLSELKGESRRTEATPGQLELLAKAEITASSEVSSARQTLTTGQLAKRLKVDTATISHWRPTGRRAKSPEELLKATRTKDPDGIGWIYLPDTKRYQPERDIPSESLEAQKSELPDIAEPEF